MFLYSKHIFLLRLFSKHIHLLRLFSTHICLASIFHAHLSTASIFHAYLSIASIFHAYLSTASISHAYLSTASIFLSNLFTASIIYALVLLSNQKSVSFRDTKAASYTRTWAAFFWKMMWIRIRSSFLIDADPDPWHIQIRQNDPDIYL